MDYCSSCRRHLNGALVCPGCGAYAPDIAPATVDSRVDASHPTGPTTAPLMTGMPPSPRTAPALPAPTWEDGPTAGGWRDGTPTAGYEEAGFAEATGFPADGYGAGEFEVGEGTTPWSMAPFARTPESDRPTDADDVDNVGVNADVDLEGVPVAPQGRAARRRQLARWKKNQRKAVVATAVALVGGGLTVMSMERHSLDRTQAAAAPDAESLGSVEEQGSQRGRTSGTETDDARRAPDGSTPWAPSGDTARDRSTANRSNSRAEQPDAPRTDAAKPSTQDARTGSSGANRSPADDTADTPSDGTTTPPTTDDSGSSSQTGGGTGTGSESGNDSNTNTGSDSGSGTESGSGSGSGGSDTGGGSDGSNSDTATTSPSGLCLLGIVCVS